MICEACTKPAKALSVYLICRVVEDMTAEIERLRAVADGDWFHDRLCCFVPCTCADPAAQASER